MHGESPQLVLEAMDSAAAVDPALLKRYQSLVGALLYCATNTRPDIAFTVGMLCRAMSKPTTALLEAAERVLAYLRTFTVTNTSDYATRPMKNRYTV